MYSQNSEEKYIVDYFKDYSTIFPFPKFIDIGAYDVFKFSNTRKLYEMGWGGILIEPAPNNYKAIADHYKDEPKIAVINAAVGAEDGEVEFYESNGDAVGTTVEDHMKKWAAAGIKYEKITVPQMKLSRLFDMYSTGFDFLSIDTESTNIQLFRMIPDFVFEQIKMICIEHDGNQEEIFARLKRFGFNILHFNAENLILAK